MSEQQTTIIDELPDGAIPEAVPLPEDTGASTASFKLLRGEIIYDTLEHKHYRILYLPDNPHSGTGYWICADGESNIPKPFEVERLQQWLAVMRCEAAVDRFAAHSDTAPSAAAQKMRERAYKAIEELVKNEPDIYDRNKRAALMKEAAAKSETKFNQLYGYLGRFWRGGMTEDALLPKLSELGKHRKPDYEPPARLGRPPKAGAEHGAKILTKTDRENFKKWIDQKYNTTLKPKLKQVYDDMTAHCYTVEGSDELLPKEQRPSYMQFYYWHKTHRDEVDESKARLGEGRFNLQGRAITGRSETGLNGPGMVYQIDATIGDFYLVQAKDRTAQVGRPVVFFVRDVRTRMIVGIYVSLENASCNSAKMALKNCAEDKVEFCRRYGIEIKPEQWPCHHLPVSILGDNGEMADYGIEDIITQLGITIQNTPPYRGDLKAVVENMFNLCNLRLEFMLPGHVTKDAGQRGSIDRRKEACLDIHTFTGIIIRLVLFLNNSWYMKSFQKTPQMRLHHVRPIPRELWNYGMQYESGALRVLKRDEIYRVLLPKDQATITDKGIKFKELYYTCEKAEKEQWFARARISGRSHVTVSFDPGCVDKIYLHSGDEPLLECTLLSRSAMYSGAAAADMESFKEADAQEEAEYRQTEDQARATLIRTIEREVERCRKEKTGETRDVVAGKVHAAGIRRNRQDEKNELSGRNAALKEQEHLTDTASKPQEAAPPPKRDAVSNAIEQALRSRGFLNKEQSEHD